MEKIEGVGETFLTADECAKILRVSKQTILRRFSDLPGVIDISEHSRFRKRPYKMLRIPVSVLRRFFEENQVA